MGTAEGQGCALGPGQSQSPRKTLYQWKEFWLLQKSHLNSPNITTMRASISHIPQDYLLDTIEGVHAM